MKARTKYLLFVAGVHILPVFLSFQLLPEKQNLFFISELALILSLFLSFKLYQQLIRPLDMIAMGVESLKDRDFSTKFVTIGQRDVDQLIGVYNKMIDQLRIERIHQREKHFFLDRLIQASPVAIIILDFEGNISSLNSAALLLPGFGGAELYGRSLESFPGRLPRELHRLQINDSRIVYLDGIQAFKCQKAHFMDKGFPHQFMIVEELTAEMLETEKKAYEKVIRMMSHEINNSIGAINSILQSVLEFQDQLNQEDQTEFAHVIQVAIDRNTHLNQFMDNFAKVVRIPPPAKTRQDLHKILRNVAALLSGGQNEKDIHWKWKLMDAPSEVLMDVHQLEQALVNVIKNAIEAIETSGTIEIQTLSSPLSLIISNDGATIDSQTQQKLFSPFFSTKQTGQGIGLTLTREVLLNHGIKFSLATEPDGFTRFRMNWGE